jgi:hypothetical protein
LASHQQSYTSSGMLENLSHTQHKRYVLPARKHAGHRMKSVWRQALAAKPDPPPIGQGTSCWKMDWWCTALHHPPASPAGARAALGTLILAVDVAASTTAIQPTLADLSVTAAAAAQAAGVAQTAAGANPVQTRAATTTSITSSRVQPAATAAARAGTGIDWQGAASTTIACSSAAGRVRCSAGLAGMGRRPPTRAMHQAALC